EARELIKRLEGSTVQRLAIEAGDTKIEIERGGVAPLPAVQAAMPPAAASAPTPGDGAAPAADGRHPIVAPLVGTFYRASQPGAKPFVEEGDVVDAGQTVAIVEAMKLMNQVQADQAGKVSESLGEDGQWVGFGQVLRYREPIGAG